MRPEEVLRAAAALIETGGHGQGSHAQGQDGQAIPLWVTGSSETGRASVNPAAVGFSIYGAIVKAIHASPDGIERQAMIWDVCYRSAVEKLDGVPLGGNNHLHPITQFSETAGRTKAEVLAFLEECAAECERIGNSAYDPPINPRAVVAPAERKTEAG